MIDMLKRHEIQVLRRAGHTWMEVAALSGVSVRTARRVAEEAAVTTVDNAAERARRQVGRPSKAEAYRDVIARALTDDGTLRSVELLHRARLAGYTGGKSALYALAQTLRPRIVVPLVRFEGLAGEFSQHDFGEVLVRYQDGTETKVHFFASRLKYSRWAEVTLVPDERVETLVRTLVDHLAAFGGIPLVAVFDRPKTVALRWGRDGVVTEWNPTFAGPRVLVPDAPNEAVPAPGIRPVAVQLAALVALQIPAENVGGLKRNQFLSAGAEFAHEGDEVGAAERRQRCLHVAVERPEDLRDVAVLLDEEVDLRHTVQDAVDIPYE
jgi:transposase